MEREFEKSICVLKKNLSYWIYIDFSFLRFNVSIYTKGSTIYEPTIWWFDKSYWNKFLKVIYFYQKMIFHLLFVHSYLSYVTSFFIIKLFRLDLRNFIQVWWATLRWCVIFVQLKGTVTNNDGFKTHSVGFVEKLQL